MLVVTLRFNLFGITTMSSARGNGKGVEETKKLLQNVNEQVNRLMQQLADLEESRDDFEEEEYQEEKEETIKQLKEFQDTLSKVRQGDEEGEFTLVDQISKAQLAIQAAVREAFKTPEVIKMFAHKQPVCLRNAFADLQEKHRLGKIEKELFISGCLEILIALKSLGEQLNEDEDAFLNEHASDMLQELNG